MNILSLSHAPYSVDPGADALRIHRESVAVVGMGREWTFTEVASRIEELICGLRWYPDLQLIDDGRVPGLGIENLLWDRQSFAAGCRHRESADATWRHRGLWRVERDQLRTRCSQAIRSAGAVHFSEWGCQRDTHLGGIPHEDRLCAVCRRVSPARSTNTEGVGNP
ncbi:hypothetical protein GCM10029964_092610 [Kibdelosporangium lantanae]